MMQIIQSFAGNPDIPFVDDRSKRGWAMVEQRLGEKPFIGGSNLTTADISGSAGAQTILDSMRKRWPWLKHLFRR